MTLWNGDDESLSRLHRAVRAHCECRNRFVCTMHRILRGSEEGAQEVLDGLSDAYRHRLALIKQEGLTVDPAPPTR